MSQRIKTKLAVGICALLFFTEVGVAHQDSQRPYGKYGGELVGEDSLIFKDKAKFRGAKFDNEANFTRAKFDNEADFSGATFNNVAVFDVVTFDGSAYFARAIFDSSAYFALAKFNGEADFSWAKFNGEAFLGTITFENKAYFRNATFNSGADFGPPSRLVNELLDSLTVFGARFNSEVDFVQARFRGTVSFIRTDFRQEVDFRQANFDSVQIIYLENIKFSEGKLRFHWDQFKGRNSLRLKLKDPPADNLKQEHYKRIEIIYHRLRDNFLVQGENASADAVMYELGWQRAEILGEFWWKMYGYFFGWGYQPWRFLLFVVLPIVIIFALVWYFVYYDVLQNAIFKRDISTSLGPQQGSKLLKAWHAIFFSFSVLLGIRFKKDWLIKHHNYLFWVTFQWGLGIGLFVTFAILAKGARFGFIRDLLGF